MVAENEKKTGLFSEAGMKLPVYVRTTQTRLGVYNLVYVFCFMSRLMLVCNYCAIIFKTN